MKKYVKTIPVSLVALMMTASTVACNHIENPSASTAQFVTPAIRLDYADSKNEEIPKPDKIVLMGTTIIPPEENGQQAIADKYKELTGITLEFIRPDHNQYDIKVNISFASGNIPDALEVSLPFYTNFSAAGVLYDITDIYQGSELKKIAIEEIVDTLRIGGRLYGFPQTRGNGSVIYIRKDWMDKLGIDMPKNNQEFLNMLRRFKDEDPNGDGQPVIPYTAPGLKNNDYLSNFLRSPDLKAEFYVRDGKVVEGMYQPEMAIALQEMQDAYQEGLIDVEIVTNQTSICREKLVAGHVGVFAYWAGMWHRELQHNLQKKFPEAELVPMPPYEGMYYVDRVPVPTVITNASKNPEAVFKYLIEYMHNGGEGQMLFTHGVEGLHYEVNNGVYTKLPDGVDPTKLFAKSSFSPELSVTRWNDPIPIDRDLLASLEIMNGNCISAQLVPQTQKLSRLITELNKAREELIAKIVLGEMNVEEGIETYRHRYDTDIQAALTELNSFLK